MNDKPSTNPDKHPAIVQVLRHFEMEDGASPEVIAVEGDFRQVAYSMANRAPASPETTVALRKLLEAKDCMLRALRD